MIPFNYACLFVWQLVGHVYAVSGGICSWGSLGCYLCGPCVCSEWSYLLLGQLGLLSVCFPLGRACCKIQGFFLCYHNLWFRSNCSSNLHMAALGLLLLKMGKDLFKCIARVSTMVYGELLLKMDSAVRHLGGLVVHLRSQFSRRSFRFLTGSETMLRAETASCGLATANNGALLLKMDSAVRHLGGLVVHETDNSEAGNLRHGDTCKRYGNTDRTSSSRAHLQQPSISAGVG